MNTKPIRFMLLGLMILLIGGFTLADPWLLNSNRWAAIGEMHLDSSALKPYTVSGRYSHFHELPASNFRHYFMSVGVCQ